MNYFNHFRFILLLFTLFFTQLFSSQKDASPLVVEVKQDKGQWSLYTNGIPYKVKGVTFGTKIDPAIIMAQMHIIASEMGANSIRTWGCGDETKLILDAAHKNNLTAMVGIWMRHGRAGAEGDDSFDWVNDEAGKKSHLDGALDCVRRYKDHPAVLTWGLGNEVILNIATEEEKNAYTKFLEVIGSAIKAEDKNHPITSVGAWSLAWPYWMKNTPSLDYYSVNTYGGGVSYLPTERKNQGVDLPYMITEYGPRGEWDAWEDENGLKVEPHDQEKFDDIYNGVTKHIFKEKVALGVYVFNFGINNDHGGNWLTFLHGKSWDDYYYRPQFYGVRQAFTGKKPNNYWPVVRKFEIIEDRGESGDWRRIRLEATDREKEELRYSFHYNARWGHREKRDAVVPLKTRGNINRGFKIQIPEEDNGVIKVYVYVYDEYGNLSIAQRSLVIEN